VPKTKCHRIHAAPYSSVAVLICYLSVACSAGRFSPKVFWTQEEKENVEHFIKSLDAANVSADMLNSEGALSLRFSRKTTQLEMNQILDQMKNALREAELVMDSVLDKAHPELKSHFRNEYQNGLKLKIRNIATEDGDFKAELQGAALLEKWGNWYDLHSREIRIPK